LFAVFSTEVELEVNVELPAAFSPVPITNEKNLNSEGAKPRLVG